MKVIFQRFHYSVIGIKRVYENNPLQYYKNSQSFDKDLLKNVLGGEALLWGNDIQGREIEARLWPRGMALAERLWTNPESSKLLAKSEIAVKFIRSIQ